MKLDQTYCTENPGHRGCGDILLLGPAKPVAAGGRGGWLLNILWPLLLGFCMAFVLNIPMRFFERHLLKNPKNKRAAALRRPLCILLSLLAIIVILTAVFALVVPELLSAVRGAGRGHPSF